MAVEPGAFRTRAYTGFAREAVEETIPAYLPTIEKVRTAMIDQDGNRPCARCGTASHGRATAIDQPTPNLRHPPVATVITYAPRS
ncbi:hypothetical protein [Micromonospora haikouensis]|uniref:hypothetical protein n=1 Tax=Micromonospora haikouensis TaxID=686309 RepID=UPI003D9369CD